MFEKIGVSIFGEIVKDYLTFFESLNLSLKKAGKDVTLLEYLCSLFFIALVIFLIMVVNTTMFFAIVLKAPLYSYTLAILISMLAGAGAFFLGYYYPSIIAKGLETKIDRSLPFACSYMATSASSGMNPVDIFKVVALRGGVVGNEANKIYTNVRSLGMSLIDAMQRTANRNPSSQFADLLWGMASVISTGGDLESYLRNRTRSLMSQYKRMLNDYAKQVTFYTELYITMVIVGEELGI